LSHAGPVIIGLISNPNSGHNTDQFEEIRALIAAQANIIHIITQSAQEIPAALQELAAMQVSVLAINGGDGTASAILGAMLERCDFEKIPTLILLPGGTANMNAGDVGMRGKLLKSVKRFCTWSSHPGSAVGQLTERRLLRVHYGEETHYGMFLGTGAVMQGTEYAHEKIHSRGLRDEFSLALGTLRTVWGVLRDDPTFNQHVSVELQLDNSPETRQHDTLILAASTLHRLFFGLKPFWGVGPGPLRLTVIEQHCSKFLRTFISIIRGRANRNAVPEAGYFSHNAHCITLSLEGSINLDGEIIHVNGPVTVDTSETLQFLRL
jgi:diacylglycerol kinase (ATP)